MDSTAPSPIHQLAQKFNIATTKPFFPINTMRLLYLIITDGLTQGNQDAIDQVNALIPKISAVFDARDQFLADNQDTNPLLEIQACQTAVSNILSTINTPVVHHTFDLLFSDLYPLQENFLLSLDRHLSEEYLQNSDLVSILKIRSMDASVYSTIIHQIILQHLPTNAPNTFTSTHYATSPIHWQVNLTLQINDLCDAVIYAPQDIKSDSTIIIDIIKKITTNPDEVEQLIFSTLKRLQDQSAKLPFPQPLQTTIRYFHHDLVQTIKTPPTPPNSPSQ